MKKRILVLGKHTEIMETVLRLINQRESLEAEGSTDFDLAVSWFAERPFDLVLLGGGVRGEEESDLRKRFAGLRPNVPVIQHFGGGSGLLFNEIQAGLEGNKKGVFEVKRSSNAPS